ncbi:MAG: undecaprenyl/decaprenyl-phosphate alpha-N-acetylglucosaminyl 1-phosphate transferase, partial [Deltaproteobacteria bacterium]|nr:undecaprenyl/decaprenyl-phosphate alpha-N-acetylglucosaminyl 1-phosphate transferase [Deltaproteobacteria bacterium]
MTIRFLWQLFIGMVILFLASPVVKTFYFNSGLRWQYIFLFAFLTAYFATPLCRILALRYHILDRPDWRKIHDVPTPLLGGLAVYIAFSFSILLNGIFLPGMNVLLLGATLILFMGIVDDAYPLPALLKFILQMAIALIVILLGKIQLTFFYNASWAPIINIPLTLLWIVGLTNAMNFFDGIDGLAASLSITSAFFLGII